MSTDDDSKVGIARMLLKADPVRLVMLVLLAAMVFGGRIVLERLVTHLDRIDAVMEKHQEASFATARAMERIVDDSTKGREAAVKEVVGEVARCCRGRR